MSVIERTASELRGALSQGELSSEEIVRCYLDRIAQTDERVQAFLAVDPDAALASAKASDARRRRGESLGVLEGLPIAVKDVLCTRGRATTCASRILEHYRPPYDATAVSRIADSGGILLGKTNLDEFAMGGSTENSAYQTTRNPWDLSRVPGGSSGGAAACVAASQAPLSLGTDTGGSIRQPAAYCGVVGLKPTYGRVSRYGLVAFASSLDQIGPLGWSVPDVALLLEAIAGHDPLDSTSADVPAANYSATVHEPLQGLRLGIATEHYESGVDDEVARITREAIACFRDSGAEIVDIHLPHSHLGIAAYYLIATSEASSNLARYDGVHYGHRADEAQLVKEWEAERRELERTGNDEGLAKLESPLLRMYRRSRAEGFGAEVKRRIMLGTYALSAGYYDAYYLKAQKIRRLIRDDFDKAFSKVDFIVGPVAPTPAFPLGAMTADPLSLYLQDLYTVTANLAGIPSLAIPCGFTSGGLPVGLQLQGPHFSEERLLRAGQMYQQATNWHQRRPVWS